MFVTNCISTTKIQKISEITNFFRHYFLSRTEVILGILLILACIFSNKRHFTNVAFIYMIILGMMRGLEVGTDHLGYESDFYLIKTFKSMNVMRHDFEIGYVSFMLLFKKFSNKYLTFASLAIPVTL